jgi:excisionase family DNA binding protein
MRLRGQEAADTPLTLYIVWHTWIVMNDELADLLPVSEVGRRLGLSAQRVRVLIDQGHLPATRTSLGRLVAIADVEAFRCHRDVFGRYRVAPSGVKEPDLAEQQLIEREEGEATP